MTDYESGMAKRQDGDYEAPVLAEPDNPGAPVPTWEDDEDVAVAVTAAAGHDTTPGHDELHHYWVAGPGLARWTTWTELRDQLLEHVSPEKAERFAAAWFHERYGFWPGDDRNRVKHGKPPRGDVVGPG